MNMKFLLDEVNVLSIWMDRAVLICGQDGAKHSAKWKTSNTVPPKKKFQHNKWEYYHCQLSASDTSKSWNSNLFLCVWVQLILNQDTRFSTVVSFCLHLISMWMMETFWMSRAPKNKPYQTNGMFAESRGSNVAFQAE